jgi:hypothetical protein
MPNCSHSSVTVKRSLRASTTNRIISSIGVIFIQGIRLGSVTHHPGLFVTYLAGSNHLMGALKLRGDSWLIRGLSCCMLVKCETIEGAGGLKEITTETKVNSAGFKVP